MAALVLAADRVPTGSDLLQILQRAGIQRKLQRDTDPDRSQPILYVVVCVGSDLALLITGGGCKVETRISARGLVP